MKFEVQTLVGQDTWENVWTEDGAPLVFVSRVEAKTSLNDHLHSCKAAGIDVHARDFRVKPAA